MLPAQSGGAVSRLDVQPWAGPALPGRTAGGYACETPDGILFAGGVPGGKDGASPVWFLPRGGDHWDRSAVVVPAWTAGAPWGEGMVCAGGIADGQPTGRVQCVGVRDGRVSATDLPPLPVAVAGASAAVVDATLYVFGGASSVEPPKLESTLWTLALVVRPARPGDRVPRCRVRGGPLCAATSQYGGFCIFGGMTPGGQGSGREKFQGLGPDLGVSPRAARGHQHDGLAAAGGPALAAGGTPARCPWARLTSSCSACRQRDGGGGICSTRRRTRPRGQSVRFSST